MIQIAFTDTEIAALAYERYYHPSPLVQQRMEVVYLKSQGVPHQEIARLCRISRQTLVTILHLYQDQGIDGSRHSTLPVNPGHSMRISPNSKHTSAPIPQPRWP